jgi:hypothetical protein
MRFLAIVGLVLGIARGVAVAAPEIHVNVPTIGIDETERTSHADAIRRAMAEAFRDANDIKHVDLVVTKLNVILNEETVDISAEIKVVVSTTSNEIRSFVSGCATFTISKRQYKPARLAQLRHQALTDALEGLSRRLRPRRVA